MPPVATAAARLRALHNHAVSIGLVGRRPVLWACGFALFAFACWNVVLGTVPLATPFLIAFLTALVGGWCAYSTAPRRDAIVPWTALDALFPAACGVLAASAPVLAFHAPTPSPSLMDGVAAVAHALPFVGDAWQAHHTVGAAGARMASYFSTAQDSSASLLALGQTAIGGFLASVWIGMGLGWPRPSPSWWRPHAARAAWALQAQGVPVVEIHLQLAHRTCSGFAPLERPFHVAIEEQANPRPHLTAFRRHAYVRAMPVALPSTSHPDAGLRRVQTPVWTMPSSAHARLAEMARHGVPQAAPRHLPA